MRDAAVASGLGIHSMAIPLAETVQNGIECIEIWPPAIDPLIRLNSLAPHLSGKWGVKLSMFYERSVLCDVLQQIRLLRPAAAIWDPIISPTSGVGLHSPASIIEAANMLSGCFWTLAPNIPEARLLAEMPEAPLETVAEKLVDMGMKNVWIRGGHGTEKMVRDLWCDCDGPKWMTPNTRLEGDPRGTGCTATSAWLAYSLNGMKPIDAADAAVKYIRRAWSALHLPGSTGRPAFPPRVQQ
jgi:hydroxymethylpyrimidine/phosphomethylpyrimidine kinase